MDAHILKIIAYVLEFQIRYFLINVLVSIDFISRTQRGSHTRYTLCKSSRFVGRSKGVFSFFHSFYPYRSHLHTSYNRLKLYVKYVASPPPPPIPLSAIDKNKPICYLKLSRHISQGYTWYRYGYLIVFEDYWKLFSLSRVPYSLRQTRVCVCRLDRSILRSWCA